jgi:V8-like Glu-specific endopeptidase
MKKFLAHLLVTGSLGIWMQSSVFAQENRSFTPRDSNKVIYGKDERADLFSPTVTDEQAQWAKSVAALVHTDELIKAGADSFKISSKTYKEQMGLCDTEPFANQPSPAFCTGFLVAPNVMVTAGHCITDASQCEATSFIFDFAYENANDDLSSVSAANVYHCKKIISQRLDDIDYAVVEIDRPAADRPTVNYRTKGTIENGAQLTLVGHPSGIPLKIAPGAQVREVKMDKGFFVATTDSYGGNSGSPVFNSVTGEVEGILVRGETDFESNGTCYVSKVCTETDCRGEDSTLISNVLPFLPKK